VGFGVLLGEGVFVGLWVTLGETVALESVLKASIITPPLSRMQPLIMVVRINPKNNPVIKPIVLLFLPIISFMMPTTYMVIIIASLFAAYLINW